ncbi:N-acetylmuramoyl-L-alanine amidase [Emticicia sp. BO119]|uniref:N-acetylmuramoyl-L-alanine amidase n=1 Tax=Emticicia sp. BO119 TaxID=2757768 RepID=UPI0015F051B4|nr:N-acetylmuramoyl-L-alanine amidase [Emticicia sp. BO119]MBA4851362.1 N-acetylmuramoyl-L-alanine amidase [Emticicia sp. BO119]
MLFLTAGHHKKDAGATYNSRKEAHETIRLRNAITTMLLSKGIAVWNDSDDWDLSHTIAEIRKYSAPENIICDLHFNAGSPSATGCEVYIPENADAIEQTLARKLSAAIATTLGIKNRGVKPESNSQHKRLGIMRPQGKNLLVEICFISSNYDMLQYDTFFDLLVERMAEVLGNPL